MATDADRNPGSSWKGKAIEHLIAAKCVLGSNGHLNVSTPFVDDAGVDLVFNLRDLPATLAVQVKARFRSSRLRHNTFSTQVREATFRPRPDFALLFVLYDDVDRQDIEAAWLVPSRRFDELTRRTSGTRKRRVFATSLGGSKGMWFGFRHEPTELPAALEDLLRILNEG